MTLTPTPTTPSPPPKTPHTLKILQPGVPLTNRTDKSVSLTLLPLVSAAVGEEAEESVRARCPVTPPCPVMNSVSFHLFLWPSRLFEREECPMLNLHTRDGGQCEKVDTDATLLLARRHRGSRQEPREHRRDIKYIWDQFGY